MHDGECCATCKYCIHIPGDEGDEWYCKKKRMDIDDAYFDKCYSYKSNDLRKADE